MDPWVLIYSMGYDLPVSLFFGTYILPDLVSRSYFRVTSMLFSHHSLSPLFLSGSNLIFICSFHQFKTQIICLRAQVAFIGKSYLEIKIWVTGVLTVTAVFCF